MPRDDALYSSEIRKQELRTEESEVLLEADESLEELNKEESL